MSTKFEAFIESDEFDDYVYEWLADVADSTETMTDRLRAAYVATPRAGDDCDAWAQAAHDERRSVEQ